MENNIYKEIGKRLRKVRQERRYTISSIAKKTGISQSSITKYEKGQDKISIEALIKICNALNIPLTFLFEENLNSYALILLDDSSIKSISCLLLFLQ